MKNLIRKISSLLVAASLAFTPAFALADRGGGDDGDRGRSGQSQSAVQLAQSNSGPGSENSGSGNMNRDEDDDDNDGDRRGNSGSSNAGSQVIEKITSGRGSDTERIRIRANGRVEIRGATITSISGTTLQITAVDRSFTVNAGAAILQDRDDNSITLSNFAVVNEVRVEGVFSPTTSTSVIAATKVVNRSLEIDDNECVEDDDHGIFDDDDDIFDDDDDGFRSSMRERHDDDDDENCQVATTTPDVIAPVISAIAAAPGVTSATISWTTNEPSTSRVFFGTTTPLDVNASTTQSVTNASLVTSHSITLSGLTASTTYVFVVRSVDAAGNASTSGQFSFATQSVATTAPVISNIAALTGVSTSTVSWTTDVPATGTVFFGTQNPLDVNATTTSSLTNPSLITNHVFPLSGLTASTTYIFVIRSGNAVGTTTSGQFSFVTTADTTAPVLSSLVAAATAPTTAAVTWTTNEPATSKVFFGTTTPLDINSSTTQSVTNASLVTDHSINLASLTASTTYFVIVQSADAGGNTTTSGQSSFTTPSVTQQVTLTAALAAQHNVQSDCWLIINGNVYSVASFISSHPAGAAPIVAACGTDATAAFNAAGHSASAVAQLAGFLLGALGQTITI